MKKLFKLAIVCLWSVMAFASCDKYSEEEYCPISLDTIYADPNSIVMTVFVNESYLQLYHCEFGAVCSTSNIPSDMGARPDFLTSLGNGKYELKFGGDFSAPKYYIHLYTASHESGKARYHECVEVKMDGTTSDTDGFRNLSATGTANCYIVSSAGRYKFRPTMGNSDEIPDIHSVEVLWESFGTDEIPEVGALIPYAEYRDFDTDGYFDVYFNATDRKGNAVIAAKDASGTILWSWHIWLTDQPEECVYANDAGTMMDRNLGATSATPGDVGALGLLYQWGRKDPFLGSSSISDVVDAQSTISWPSAIESDALNGTILYATQCPTQFIMCNTINYDWYYTGDSTTDDTRWQSEKTIYDPCPAGWRVLDGGSDGVWAKAGFLSGFHSYDSIDKGMLFDIDFSSPASWYSAAGFRYYRDGGLFGVGYYGYYWSITPNDSYVYSLYFRDDVSIIPLNFYRANGQSVRCLKE